MTKVLPTDYAGVRFRSRTEARWARFFDAVRVDWEYEPEGFYLGDTGYLPDFWIPDWGYWFEVKPIVAFNQQRSLIEKLSEASGKPAILANGSPTVKRANLLLHDREPGRDAGDYVWWRNVQIVSDRKSEKLLWLTHDDGARSLGKGDFSDKWPGHLSGWLENAYLAAKNEKFGIL